MRNSSYIQPAILLRLFSCVVFLAASSVGAQETFKNPAMEPDDEFHKTLTRARVLARRGDTDEAIKEFRKAAKLRNDECAECFQFIGITNFQVENYNEAAAAFKQAVALKPKNEAELCNWLGVSLYLEGDKKLLEEAASALRRAVELSEGKLNRAKYNLGYALIKLGREEEGKASLKAYLDAEPNGTEAFAARSVLENPRLVNERFALAFRVSSTTGDELSLDKLRGKIILLDFWATWCLPCRIEMPEVKRIWKKYSGDQFVIVGVSLDQNRSTFEQYLKQEGISWPQYFDGKGWGNALAQIYGVQSIPHSVLIDQNGIIRGTGLHGRALANRVGDLLKKLTKQEPSARN